MTKKEYLEEAIKCTCGDRQDDYGTPEDNFQAIADLWEPYLRRKCVGAGGHVSITSEDVAVLMCLFKIGRVTSGRFKNDNFVDLAGYAACAGEVASIHDKCGAEHNVE